MDAIPRMNNAIGLLSKLDSAIVKDGLNARQFIAQHGITMANTHAMQGAQ